MRGGCVQKLIVAQASKKHSPFAGECFESIRVSVVYCGNENETGTTAHAA